MLLQQQVEIVARQSLALDEFLRGEVQVVAPPCEDGHRAAVCGGDQRLEWLG